MPTGERTRSVRGPIDTAFVEHERYLWGLCYRMTGSAADADDLVQDTFARAVEKPPKDTAQSLRPWLVRVAMNLARDRLRRRRRKKYGGDWLPAPIEVLEREPTIDEPTNTAARYDLMESVSMAFLVALETLSPAARAVLLLRDVFDYSVKETATALAMNEPNVKTTLHRARKKMSGYDAERTPTVDIDKSRAVMIAFCEKLIAGDVAGIEDLLSDEVIARSDGGGRYHAANKPVVGNTKVARFMMNIATKRGPPVWFQFATLNGWPAILTRFTPRPHEGSIVAMVFETNEAGKIHRVYSQLVEEKLVGVPFDT